MGEDDRVFVLPAFADVATRAPGTVIDPTQAPDRIAKAQVAPAIVSAAVQELGILPAEAVDEVARQLGGEHLDAMLRAVAAGRSLVES